MGEHDEHEGLKTVLKNPCEGVHLLGLVIIHTRKMLSFLLFILLILTILIQP